MISYWGTTPFEEMCKGLGAGVFQLEKPKLVPTLTAASTEKVASSPPYDVVPERDGK
jgi:hypothetical protein